MTFKRCFVSFVLLVPTLVFCVFVIVFAGLSGQITWGSARRIAGIGDDAGLDEDDTP